MRCRVGALDLYQAVRAYQTVRARAGLVDPRVRTKGDLLDRDALIKFIVGARFRLGFGAVLHGRVGVRLCDRPSQTLCDLLGHIVRAGSAIAALCLGNHVGNARGSHFAESQCLPGIRALNDFLDHCATLRFLLSAEMARSKSLAGNWAIPSIRKYFENAS